MPDIRVGLIRCDTHGMWFGAQMMDHDARLLERATDDPELKKAYTWLTRGVHYFFYSHYSAPQRMTAPRVDGFEITRLWDNNREVAAIASDVFYGKPRVCNSFEEVSDEVDLVFIADCNGDGSDHLQLAIPGLTKGVPTFIDKPFANNNANAQAILDLACQTNTPLLSLSILQTNPATTMFKRRLSEVGRVSFGSVTGHSTARNALIHAISVAHHLFGTGIETVHAMRTPRHTTIHLDYGLRDDRPAHGVTVHCGTASFRFTRMYAAAYGPQGAIQGLCMDDFNASDGSAIILEHCRTMVQSGAATSLFNEMIEAIAVMDAALRAEATGQPQRVASI